MKALVASTESFIAFDSVEMSMERYMWDWTLYESYEEVGKRTLRDDNRVHMFDLMKLKYCRLSLRGEVLQVA